MCGICGIYHFDPERFVDEWRISKMKQSIKHRGPDDSGDLIRRNMGLGHQRLSIIDLLPSGHQPMAEETGRYWIIFNGEIYNYIELREMLKTRGRVFHSTSDTEVILKLYQEFGKDCVLHMNGMFAFVIWDQVENTLFIARDRLGIKPFYYVLNHGSFIFASEIKAIFASELVEPEINEEGLKDYITYQFCLGEKTMFKNVEKLLPGHFMVVKPDGNVTISPYWKLDFDLDLDHSDTWFEEKLSELLEDAIRLQLRADVPVGSHLSGGLDSSMVACLASSMSETRIHTFSGGFHEGSQYDETRYARMVAEKTHSIHHEIFPTREDFVASMPQIIYTMDEPAAGPGLFPQVFVSQLASRNVKVVMGGQGADELFGGYVRYLIAYLEECIRGGIEGTQEDHNYIVTLDSILPNLQQLDGYQPLLKYFWKDGLFESPDLRYFRLINREREMHPYINPIYLQSCTYDPFETYRQLFNHDNLKSYINKMTRFDLLTLLPALLQVEDRTSMIVSLESRVPILDHRIVELAATMPPMIKYRGGRSKYIFRKVAEKIVPEGVTNRKDKMGFPVPLSEWYSQPVVREFIHEVLLGRKARQRGLVNTEAIEAGISNERAFDRGLWGMICLELWMNAFFDEPKWK
jgi:asparagine synthase (glutamine-hydrolysing)